MTPAQALYLEWLICHSSMGLRVQPPLTNGAGQGVYIANAGQTFNHSGIGKPVGLVLSTKTHPPLSIGGSPTAANIQNYLAWGVTHADGTKFSFHGFCEGFANVSAAIAIGNATNVTAGGPPASPLLPASIVEVMSSGTPQTGHLYVVIDRPGAVAGVFTPPGGATIAGAIDSWGANCYIVDPWYALLASTAAAPLPMVVQASTVTAASPMGAALNGFGARRVVASYQKGAVAGLNLSKWRP